jgi:hypothetical protein
MTFPEWPAWMRLSWVLSLGPEAQVLEPARLKQMVRADLQKSLGQYSGNRVYYEISETQAIRRMS